MCSGMNDDDFHSIDELRHWIARSKRIVAFTGAGISTECGVPDFRSPGSPWLVNKPIPYQAFVASEEVRREAWRRKFVMDDHYRSAQPGRGHAALAALYARGTLTCVVTQNIDDLHQRSGLPAHMVVELHGNGTYATCLDCGLRHELGPIRTEFEQTGEAPRCMSCVGPVKSATVSFGQACRNRPCASGRDRGVMRSPAYHWIVARGAAGSPFPAPGKAIRCAAGTAQPRAHASRS